MRVSLALILLATSWAVAAASSDESNGRTLTQFADPGSGTCPINYCKDASNCIYNSRIKAWKCKACTAPRMPNKAQTECVCPAGTYPTASGACVQCKLNFYCPLGTSATKSTAKACPANTVTLTKGAKSINDCYNSPGYRYLKTSSGVRAIACGDNEYSTGLKKQVACTKCMPGFVTDPTNPPGVHTSSAVCVAPLGYFVSGDSVAPCPKGEYSDEYSAATSCTLCEDAVAQGVTTEKEASISKANCSYLEPGYAWVNDKNKVVIGVFNPLTMTATGTKSCPQSYYCPGGSYSASAPTACPGGSWTEDEGAIAVDECVAPPGWYWNGTNLVECPQATFKDTWDKTGLSSCKACGTGLWLSDKNTFINKLDPNTGAVAQQISVRGSSDSCYIQRGMGAILDRNLTTGVSSIKAILCPIDTYGVVGTLNDGVYKKYGQVVTPCTACPTNMKTGQFNDAAFAVTSYKSKFGDYNTSTVSVNTTVGGYYDVQACANIDGYGYYAGSSQICPAGYYNVKGNKLPCSKCPLGMTTDFQVSININADYCIKYIAGYGYVNGVTSKCLPGTYMVEQTSKNVTGVPYGVPCKSCPTGRTTAGYGSVKEDDCNLCDQGYGGRNYTLCAPCGDGYYGPAGRDTTPCVACPTGRTYTYSWDGTDDVFTPLATSPLGANTTDDCVADFAQTVDGAFYLNLTSGPEVVTVTDGGDTVATCVQRCRDDDSCAAVIFDYYALVTGGRPCSLWKPKTVSSFTDAGGVAVKVFPSTNLAKKAKAMGNGQYTFWMDGSNTGVPARISPGALTNVTAAAATLSACLDACTALNLCVGVVFGAYNYTTNTVASCQTITASVLPGDSKRTLIKANFNSYINTLIVPAGFYTDDKSTVIKICNDVSVVDDGVGSAEVSYYCPGGVVGSSPRLGCGPVPAPAITAEGALNTPPDAKSTADCWSILQPGFYSPTGAKSATVACSNDTYCLGGDIVFDTAPNTTIGLTLCPDGTDTPGVTTPDIAFKTSAACSILNPNYYYNATADPGYISGVSVKLCPPGFWCAGASSITIGTSIDAVACPPGTSSAAGQDQEIDCTILLPTWYYNGPAAISNTTVKTCPVNGYCAGDANIQSGTAAGITDCPGYTCDNTNGNCTANSNTNGGNPGGSGTVGTGKSSLNDCINLDPGYYYEPGTTYAVSSSVGASTTVRECPAGSYCDGSVNINLRVQSGLTGSCPTGSTSTANSNEINDCINLLQGYYYTGGAGISTSTVQVCAPGNFCDGNTDINATALATPAGLTPCASGFTCTNGTSCTSAGSCI